MNRLVRAAFEKACVFLSATCDFMAEEGAAPTSNAIVWGALGTVAVALAIVCANWFSGFYDGVFLIVMLTTGVGALYEWRRKVFPNWLALPSLLFIITWRAFGNLQSWGVVLLMWGVAFGLWFYDRSQFEGGDAKALMIFCGMWPTEKILLGFIFGWSLWMLGFVVLINFIHFRGRLSSLASWFVTNVPLAAATRNSGRKTAFLIPSWLFALVFYFLWARPVVGEFLH